MSNTRKIISLVLAVVMALSVFTICATAAGETATWTVEVTKTDGSALDATVPVGDHVKVTVKLQSNFYVGTVGLPVYFSDAFSFVAGSAVLTDIYGAGATRTAINENYTAPSGKKAFYAVFVPNSGAAGAAAPMYSTATTIVTFELEAVSEATAQVYLDAAKQKTSSNPGGVFYVGAHATSDVKSDEEVVETFTVPAAVDVVIANASADPVLIGVNGGYVDDANGYVYGIPVGEDPADYFELEDPSAGSIVISGDAATGATLTVKDSSNNDFAVYTIIIFGDVNGDGEITGADEAIVYDATNFIDITDPAQAFAADVNGDGELTGADEAIIYDATNFIAITANPYA